MQQQRPRPPLFLSAIPRYGDNFFMQPSTSPSVIKIWMPLFLLVFAGMLLRGMALPYWSLSLPLLIVAFFCMTLAEISREGTRVRIRTFWRWKEVPQKNVVRFGTSFLEGIGFVELNYFVFPWGKIYFLGERPDHSVLQNAIHSEGEKDSAGRPSHVWSVIGSVLMAISGLICARAISPGIQELSLTSSTAKSSSIVGTIVLLLLFLAVRKKNRAFANILIFCAGFVVGILFG